MQQIGTLPLHQAKGIFYLTDILDSYPPSTHLRQLQRTSVNPNLFTQTFLIQEKPTVLLKTYTYLQAKDDIERIKASFESAKTLTYSHINLAKLMSIKYVESSPAFHVECLYENDGVDVQSFLMDQQYEEQAVNSVALQTAAGMTHLHRKGVSHGSFVKENVKVNNGIVKIGNVPIRVEDEESNIVVPPQLQTARQLETKEKIDVYSWGVFMYKICVNSNSPVKCEDETCIKEMKEKLGKTKFTDQAKIVAKCLSYDPAERPSFSEIFAELTNSFTSSTEKAVTEIDEKKEAETISAIKECIVEVKGKKVSLQERQTFGILLRT